MTSVVDKYYRRIVQNIDNVTMKFDISSLLVKTKDHDSKIDTNKSNIAENLKSIREKSDIIEDNKSNITENLKLIGERSDIIEENKSNIAEIFKKINELIALLKSKIPEKIFKKAYSIVNNKFNLNRTLHYHEIFSMDIENNFT